jgi:AcrR family transcriptional regulator
MTRRAAPAGEPSLLEGTARWEERSVSRVLRSGRERVLARSRRFVRAAQEILAASGFEGLTVRAVLDRTSLSRRAFYERFDGIDDLILAVFEQTFRDGAASLRVDMAEIDDPLARLRFVIDTMLLGPGSGTSIRYATVMSREHLRLAEARPDELKRALEPLTSLLAEQLAAGMERGVVRQGDPTQLATLVQHLVAATTHASLLSSGPETRAADSAAALWEFCLRAVRADPPERADGARNR